MSPARILTSAVTAAPWVRKGTDKLVLAVWIVSMLLTGAVAVAYWQDTRIRALGDSRHVSQVFLQQAAHTYQDVLDDVTLRSELILRRWTMMASGSVAAATGDAFADFLTEIRRLSPSLADIVVLGSDGRVLHAAPDGTDRFPTGMRLEIPRGVDGMAAQDTIFIDGAPDLPGTAPTSDPMLRLWLRLSADDGSESPVVMYLYRLDMESILPDVVGLLHRRVGITRSADSPDGANPGDISVFAGIPWLSRDGAYEQITYRLPGAAGLDTIMLETDMDALLRHDWWTGMRVAAVVLVFLIAAITILAFVLRAGFRRIEKALRGSIMLLARSQKAQDQYTGDHQTNVAELAMAIGRRLRLSARQMLYLELGANIHDVGKLSIPTQLLVKPGTLIAEEMALLRTHPESGFEIAQSAHVPVAVTHVVRHHHERWDGTGYPDGLAGNAIPLLARIVAVADAVESGTSHRPYRPAISVEEMTADLRTLSGTRFDPAITRVCLDVIAAHEVGWLHARAAADTAPDDRRAA